MKSDNRTYQNEYSSVLSLGIVQISTVLIGGLAAFYSQPLISMLAFALALTGFLSKRWSRLSARHLSVRFESDERYFFPGNRTAFRFKVENKGGLPVPWIRISIPLFVPLHMRPADSSALRPMTGDEKTIYGIADNCLGFMFEVSFRSLGPRNKTVYETVWTALKRGIISINKTVCLTGDPFDIARTSVRPESSGIDSFVIYPSLIPVDTAFFTRNKWEGENDVKGILEDPSLIRLTRPYTDGEPAKKINWRILSRSDEITVNQYEVIRPKHIHFIFDGQSFCGHNDELEKVLSVMASLLLELDKVGISLGLSFPKSRGMAPANIEPSNENIKICLFRMAEYMPYTVTGEDSSIIVPESVFDKKDMDQVIAMSNRVYTISFEKYEEFLGMGGVKP